MRTLILSLGFIGIVPFLFAQDYEEADMERMVDERFQLQDMEISYEALYETLMLRYANPLDLNTATYDDLASLYLLSTAQLNAFVAYREQFGNLLSMYELQAIPELDEETIFRLRPFVTVESKSDSRKLFKRIREEENHYFLLRYTRNLQQQQTDGTGFQGNPEQVYGRYLLRRPGDFSIGFTFEKDPGESIRWNQTRNQYGFDFYSMHLLLENQGCFNKIILGDYQVQLGQGLVFGSGFSTGKGAETIHTAMKNNLGIRPYSSALEAGFLRGGATTIKIKRVESTLLVSGLRQDARLVTDSTYSAFDEFINGIQSTGYHRTVHELEAKNKLTEWTAGGALRIQLNRHATIGATGLLTRYSFPIQKKPTYYNQFEFSGKQNSVGSLFGNYKWQNTLFFAEAARSQSGGLGMIAGMITSLTSKIDFSWSVRNYERNFHSFYGNGFGENARNINEKGMYCGLKYRPSRQWEFAGYADWFHFPWMKYRTAAPSNGREVLGRIGFQPSRRIQMYVQFREEQKEQNQRSGTQNLLQIVPTLKRNYVFGLDYEFNQFLRFKTRIQGSQFRKDNQLSSGFTMVQDLNLRWKKLKFSTRFALFDTQNFDNRQYVYERDVLYSFSIPAYHGAGIRTYLLMQYDLLKNIRIYARYSRSKYLDNPNPNSEISSMDEDHPSQIKLLLRLKL